MSLLQRFARGVLWTLIGTVASRLFALVIAVVTARLLGKAGFGELGMIQSTIGLMGTFAGFGLGMTTTKYVAELKDKDPARAGRIIALSNAVALLTGGIMALVCVLASPWLAQKTINAPQLVPELRLGAALLFTSALLGVQTGTLAGFQAFKALARINFYQGIISLPLALTMIFLWGLMGAVLSLVFTSVVGVLLSSRALAGECNAAGITVDFHRAWTERRTLWDFSLPAVMGGLMVSPVTWAANAMLVNQPNGYAELGLFNAANQFRMLIMFLPNILGMVTVPLLSEIHGQNDREFFARAVNLNLRTIWGLALPCGFLLIGLSSWLINLFGPQYQQGRPVLAIMICVAIMYLAGSTVGQALISSGRMWAGFFVNLGWALVLLPSVSLLIPRMGAKGMAISYLLAYSFLTLSVLGYTAINFGRVGVHHSPVLLILTFVISLFALGIGKLSEVSIVVLSLLFILVTTLSGWLILSRNERNKIIDFFG
jgi:O-antigen/teichoic acid export membrane protein